MSTSKLDQLKELYASEDPNNPDPVLIAELSRSLARSGCDEVRMAIFNCLGIPPWEIEAEKDKYLLDLFSEGTLSVAIKDGQRILIARGTEAMMNSICTDPTSFLHDKYDKLIIISPETLTTLEARFRANMHMHEGVVWEEVKHSLELNPEALKSLALMEAAGHEPDVYHDDENDFYFGTCSKEVPQSSRNLDYFDAEKQASQIGINLMSEDHYKDILQMKYEFDLGSYSWLYTNQERLTGLRMAIVGGRYSSSISSYYRYASRQFPDSGWRGSISIKIALKTNARRNKIAP